MMKSKRQNQRKSRKGRKTQKRRGGYRLSPANFRGMPVGGVTGCHEMGLQGNMLECPWSTFDYVALNYNSNKGGKRGKRTSKSKKGKKQMRKARTHRRIVMRRGGIGSGTGAFSKASSFVSRLGQQAATVGKEVAGELGKEAYSQALRKTLKQSPLKFPVSAVSSIGKQKIITPTARTPMSVGFQPVSMSKASVSPALEEYKKSMSPVIQHLSFEDEDED